MLQLKSNTRVWLCPTDTIYGLSARVSDGEAVERVRQVKGGREGMHFITLLSDIEQLAKLGVSITNKQKDFLNKVWPGAVSVIIGDDAFRLPDYPELRELIKEVGPIISTSANRHGDAPVQSAQEAKEIFGSEVDEYLVPEGQNHIGCLSEQASTLVKIIR